MDVFEDDPNVTPGPAEDVKTEDKDGTVARARPIDDSTLVSELYFLIAKFLSEGPLKQTAQTLIKELESEEVLPRRLDWQGREHAQTFEQLERQYPEICRSRLTAVCGRALQLAASRSALQPRLSLLGAAAGDGRVRGHDSSLVRRLCEREQGRPTAPQTQLFSSSMLKNMQLQRRTLGHLSAVYCVVFDASGSFVLTGADDYLLKLWRVEDGTLRATLRGAAAEITDLCVSHDNRFVAAGCVDRCVRLWALRTGAALAVLPGTGTVTAVQWRPPGTRRAALAATSTDGSVAFWTQAGDDWTVRRLLERTRPGVCHMICAAWSAGGLFLATGCADHRVRVYRLEEGDVRRDLELEAHADAVDSVRWAHEGLRFVSGSKDGTAALWGLRAGRWRHRVLRAAPSKLKVTMVCWARADTLVLLAVSDSSLEAWSARGQHVRTLRAHADEVYVLEPHPFLPHVLLSAGHDGQLLLWDLARPVPLLARFRNEGQAGPGAVFDAKWSPCGARLAACDSAGHLLLLGLGRGHRLLRALPRDLFFHTDYRPLSRDRAGLPLDELSGLPPHRLPPPWLVDVDGAPLPPRLQRLVPGRAGGPPPLDRLLRELAGGEAGRGEAGRGEAGRGEAGRGEAEWGEAGCGEGAPPPPAGELVCARARAESRLAAELAQYRREMRKKPHMITTQPVPRPRNTKRTVRPPPETRSPSPPPSSSSEEADSSLRLSQDSSGTSSMSKSDSDKSSSSGSEWESRRAPRRSPPRARRRRRVARRFSPDESPSRPSTSSAPPPPPPPPPPVSPPPVPPLEPVPVPPPEPAPSSSEWLTGVWPRKSPYQPQIGDECVYFRLGHERYFEAVEEKQVYKVHPRDKPWTKGPLPACMLVRVTDIRFSLRPARVASLRLAAEGRVFTAKYHDMPDVIDFLVLAQHFRTALARDWKQGDRFRCVIDECWWSGSVLENSAGSWVESSWGAGEWEAAAAHYLSVRVLWDNGEQDRLSPWDLEPAAPGGEPQPLGPGESDGPPYLPEPADWPSGPPEEVCPLLSSALETVMSLSVAESLCAPPAAPLACPLDLRTIRARLDNLYYRRLAACEYDARLLASNCERLSRRPGARGDAPGARGDSPRRARLVRDLLLALLEDPRAAVLPTYRRLARDTLWPESCRKILREIWSSCDAEPFRSPVSPEVAPDYSRVVREPVDLSLVAHRLRNGLYRDQNQFCRDMRLMFRNSRQYNTNRQSLIHCMTVRLSAHFESLWARLPRPHARRRAAEEEELHSGRRRRGVKRSSRRRAAAPRQGDTPYESDSPRPPRRRKAPSSSSEDTYSPRRDHHRRNTYKHAKRRKSSSSSSSTSAGLSGRDSGRHYESDRSYRPRYSSDDDQPLTQLRQQSSSSRPTTSRSASRPAVRTPRSSVRYNEDSDDETVAAISKRERHANTNRRLPAPPPPPAAPPAPPATNGHTSRPHRTAGGSSSSSSEAPLVSSRGRVRRLTAKGRGMLRD